MACSMPYYNSYVSAVTKKTTKDTTRWQPEHHPAPDQSLSNHTHRHRDDGGWSTGIPARGSGWRKTILATDPPHKEPSQPNDNQTSSSGDWDNGQPTSDKSVGVESWSQDNSNKLKSESETWGRNDVGWSSDQEGGSSRSQSPGGLVMVVKQVESSTPSKDNGTGSWDSKPVGSNWKMHTLDTKAPESSPEELTGESHVGGRGIQEGEWEDLDAVSLSSNERDTAALLDRENACHKTSSSDDGGGASGDTNSDPGQPDRYRGSNSQETGNELNSRSAIQSGSSTPGNATPTQELGGAWRSGRTSVGSTSSLSEVNSCGLKGGMKGGQQMRSTSPRKMNRYDQSGSNGINRGGLILPRPRKSIAELEGGLESLHMAPSGWGVLPSPQSNDMDKGTEFWGIPPDDVARMTGAQQQPSIKAWNESRSPRGKGTEWSEETSGWSSNGNAANGGWGSGEDVPSSKWEVGTEKKHPPLSDGYYNDSGLTPPGPEPVLHPSHSGLDLTSVPNHSDTSSSNYPIKTRLVTNIGSHDPKDPSFQFGGQAQMMQNQVLVKNLVIGYRQLNKLQLGQIESPGSIQSLQKSLSQQLSRAQVVQQQLLSQIGQTSLPAQHPLNVQLSQTNDIINQIKQHIVQNQQMLNQHKEVKGRDRIGSMGFGPSHQTNTPPVTPTMQLRGKGDQPGPGISHSHSSNAILSMGGDNKDLTYGIRDMSLSQWSQSSQQTSSAARSVSRLQRIISGSPTQENLSEMSEYQSYGTKAMGYSSGSPFSPPYGTVGTTAANSAKPVHQIQEFKPGVPWQPRKMSGDSSQLHANQDQHHGVQRSLSQVHSSSYGQLNRHGGQRSRSQSTDTGYYGNHSPSSNKYGTIPSSRGDLSWTQHDNHSSRQSNFPQRSWSGGQRPNRISLPSSSHHSGNLPTPDNVPMGWRQGRSAQPPSTLIPKQDFQYRSQFEGSRSRSRGTPIDAHPQHSDNSQWFPETPGSSDVMSSSVWGSGSATPPVDRQGSWPQHKNGRGWIKGSHGSSPLPPPNTPLKEHYSATTPGSADSLSRWITGTEGFPQSSPEPTFAEWQAGKKARLSSTSSTQPTSPPLSPWLVIRSISAQLDIQRLKDACKGYGDVKSFIGSPGADFVLVCYSSVEEAMRAKPCIDRLWGGHVSTEFVPEGDLEMHCQQLTMSEPSVFAPPPKQVPPSSFHPTLAEGERSRWDSQDMRAFSFERQASKASTPGSSSVWSDGGFLSGISSPWSSDFSGTLASPSTGYHSDILSTSSAATTPLTQDSIESSSSRNSSVLPTFLPSGLL